MPKTAKSPDYESLGKMLVELHELGYTSAKKAYKQSFIKGLLSGFGAVIGGTILVALLLWTLSFFNEVPGVGRIVDTVQKSLQK